MLAHVYTVHGSGVSAQACHARQHVLSTSAECTPAIMEHMHALTVIPARVRTCTECALILGISKHDVPGQKVLFWFRENFVDVQIR